MPSDPKKISQRLIYLLSFLEGAGVMVVELGGARMMAPFFGTSIYVWSAVMAITLGGLAGGYFTGGWLARQKKTADNLFRVLFGAGFFAIIMALGGHTVMEFLFGFPFLLAIVFSALVIILPAVFLMGCFSPLVVETLSVNAKHAGRVAGNVFAISTLGGISATFLFGFWILPSFGITLPLFVTGIVLCLAAWLIKRKLHASLLLLTGIILWGSLQIKQQLQNRPSFFQVSDVQEGLLGQVGVMRQPLKANDSLVSGTGTALMVNRVMQAWMEQRGNTVRYFPYAHRIADGIASGAGSSALVLGLGGGCLPNLLVEKGMQVTAVEFDQRITALAKKHFKLRHEVKVVHQDARYYINSVKEKFNLIVFDVFRGEETPSHLITMESMEKIHGLLEPGGTVVLNGYNFWDGEIGKGVRAICKTFLNAGFQVVLSPTSPTMGEGNLLMVVKRTCDAMDWKQESHLPAYSDLTEVDPLTDDLPTLDHLNRMAALSWREIYRDRALRYQLENRVRLY